MIKTPLLLLLVLFCYNANELRAQTTLTKGQIFDFEVGDEFHYSRGGNHSYGIHLNRIIRKRILEKQFSANGTQVDYTIEQISYDKEFTDWCSTTQDTIVETYTDLDSLIALRYADGEPVPDLLVCSADFYGVQFTETPGDTAFNNRTTLYTSSSYNVTERVVAGAGLQYLYSSYFPCSESMQLQYFKKGAEEWGTPIAELVDALPIVPTPQMTFQEVYDFDLYDVFQHREEVFGYMYFVSRIVQRQVVQKMVAADQVTYVFCVMDSIVGASSHTERADTVTYEYSSRPILETEENCYILESTIDTCANRVVNEYNYQTNYTTNYQKYIKGCGRYGQTSSVDMSVGVSTGNRSTLLYYYKAASGETCGNYTLLSITELPSKLNIKAYFNPATQQLQLTYPSSSKAGILLITDIMGRSVYNGRLAENTDNYSVSAAGWAKGVYVVSINGSAVKTIVHP